MPGYYREGFIQCVTTAAWAEMWNRKNCIFIHCHNVIYCSVWKGLRNPPKIIEKTEIKLEIEQNYIWDKMEYILNSC